MTTNPEETAAQQQEWLKIRNQISWKLLVRYNQNKDLSYDNPKKISKNIKRLAKELDCPKSKLIAFLEALVINNYQAFCDKLGFEKRFSAQASDDNVCWRFLVWHSKKRGLCLKSKGIDFATEATELGFKEEHIKRFYLELLNQMMEDYMKQFEKKKWPWTLLPKGR